MPIDIILDANVPKKVKNMTNDRRVLHIGDVDTAMEDDDILHLASKFDCLVVTHDRELAYKASKKTKTLFIKENVAASDIIGCINKNENLLKTASIFCENGRKCKNC